MATLFHLHDLRWTDRGGSTLTSERARGFLTEFAEAAARVGWLRLWVLEAGDTPIGAWLGWRLGHRYAFFQSGFDPAFGRYSPGLLMMANAIRDALSEKASEFDMLLGDEAYKARFAPDQRAVSTVVLSPAAGAARLTTAADLGLRRLGRRLPPGTRQRLRTLAAPIMRQLPTSRNR
jgi:CelD/BcsL family acetyltransferase involved in cellulose biosynthesis